MAHLGTYTTGGITYDRHTGRAISGTDTVDTEFAEEFNGTYIEINLDPYDQVSDKDGGFFDATANMYMNANGEMILTSGGTNDGDSFSAASVRESLRNLISNEPMNNPFSDEILVNKLQSQGISLARRTVAKYRELLNIPSSSIRRRMMKIQNLRFGEAVKHLAILAGMQPYIFSKQDEEREKKWKIYSLIFDKYINFYHDELLKNENHFHEKSIEM